MKKLGGIQKDFQILNRLYLNITEKEKIILQKWMIAECLGKIIQ